MEVSKIKLVLQQVACVECEILEETEIGSLGLDSLDMINFLFGLEQESGVRIPDEKISNGKIRTIKCLIDHINNEKST